MAKVHLTALDYIIVASHYAANGKPKAALKMLTLATEEEDFEDTLTTLDVGNEEGWDDGEDLVDNGEGEELDDAEEELSVALANLKNTRRRRAVTANDDADADDLGEDDQDDEGTEEGDELTSEEDLDLEDDSADTEEELSTLRVSKRDRNLKVLNRLNNK